MGAVGALDVYTLSNFSHTRARSYLRGGGLWQFHIVGPIP